MHFSCTLALPRDFRAVPIVRRFCRTAMTELGVTTECADGVAIAITEACSNVVEHSSSADEFTFSLELDGSRCSISVTDPMGFDLDALPSRERPDPMADRGRGLFLIAELMDSLTFRHGEGPAVTICFDKELEFDPDHHWASAR